MAVVDETGDPVALRRLTGPGPDVVVADVDSWEILLRASTDRHPLPTSRVVLVAEDLAPEHLLAFLSSGIRAVVFRLGSAEDIVRAVSCVARGGDFLSPRFLGPLLSALRAHPPQRLYRMDRALGQLTPRERTVCKLICRGMANHEIASALRISEKTVKFHVSNILSKTGARTRAQIIAGLSGSGG